MTHNERNEGTMTQQQINDPFAGAEGLPSLSFKDAPLGTTHTGVVTRAPELVQSRDFETGEPAFWKDGNPKMAVVLHMRLDSTGDEVAVWAAKPSSMFAAMGAAQKAAGAQISLGGRLAVTLQGEKPNDNPRLNAQKLYAVRYQPGDAFAGEAAPAQAITPAYAQQPAPTPYVPQAQAPAPVAPQPAAQPVAAPASGPTPEQIAALKAMGLDPATVFGAQAG